jgi:hypothetical protein
VLGGFIFSIGLPIIVLLASAHAGVIAQALPAQVVSLIIAVPFALALVGTALVSGRKRTILLLRKFGDRTLSERIRASLEALLHWHYRLVALDDSTLPPIGVAGSRFRRTVLLLVAAIVSVLIAIGALSLWIRNAGESADPIDVWTAVAALVMLVPMGGVALLVVPSVYFARGRVRRASHVNVADDGSLATATRKVRRQRRWLNSLSLTAPQALILNTSDALWKATLLALLPVVDVVVVDLSEPTENIEWEIAQVFERCPDKCTSSDAGRRCERTWKRRRPRPPRGSSNGSRERPCSPTNRTTVWIPRICCSPSMPSAARPCPARRRAPCVDYRCHGL